MATCSLPSSPLRAPTPTSPGANHAKPPRPQVDWQTRGTGRWIVADPRMQHLCNSRSVSLTLRYMICCEIPAGCKLLTGSKAARNTAGYVGEDPCGCGRRRQTREGNRCGYKGENGVPLHACNIKTAPVELARFKSPATGRLETERCGKSLGKAHGQQWI